uniref:Uncharacterized protein n=1 Tax=Anopheles farauti TaxID=69004 RepID=A0A182QXT5_9DIPT
MLIPSRGNARCVQAPMQCPCETTFSWRGGMMCRQFGSMPTDRTPASCSRSFPELSAICCSIAPLSSESGPSSASSGACGSTVSSRDLSAMLRCCLLRFFRGGNLLGRRLPGKLTKKHQPLFLPPVFFKAEVSLRPLRGTTYVRSTGPISDDGVAVHRLQPEAGMATVARQLLQLLRQTLALVQDEMVQVEDARARIEHRLVLRMDRRREEKENGEIDWNRERHGHNKKPRFGPIAIV